MVRRRRRQISDRLWGGSRYFTNRIIAIVGDRAPVTSRKRWATFGNPGSDHHRSQRLADAVDFGIADAHALKNEISRKLGGPDPVDDYEHFHLKHGGRTYRLQLIAGTHGTGPHLHAGARKIAGARVRTRGLRASLKRWKQAQAKAKRLVRRRRRQIETAEREQATTARGRDFLVREEGAIPYAYNDPAGHATFGVGHLIHRGPVTNADRRTWGTRANPKPMGFVMDVLAEDLKRYEMAVRGAAGRELTSYQFDSLVSLAFNIGSTGFARSTVAREIRERKRGWRRRAADAFLLWSNPPILRPRRERERRLFLTGRYS